MRFISTRGQSEPLGFQDAVATGLAPDGGLYIPEELPSIGPQLEQWASLDYPELAASFLKLFASDLDPSRLDSLCRQAYAHFDVPETAPLRQLDEGLQVLELFHGPTLAFKDFALQLLGLLYEEQIMRTGEAITVLGATSGDTGSAAIHGLLNREGVNICILYPRGGIAPLQERQMACTGASNVFPVAIEGSFDDAQRIIKALFSDSALRLGYRLSAVNSINLARILAQCVYYIYAWLRLPTEIRHRRTPPIEFLVPTGNFGNVLAGWMARQMGLPVDRFCVATNQNDILHRLFTTGEYVLGPVHPTHAPSMDIQVASNFERFLFYHEGRNSGRVREVLQSFADTGQHHFSEFNPDSFRATRMDNLQIIETMTRLYERYNYIVDPHTACGFAEIDPDMVSVVLATAHPAKFPEAAREAIGREVTHPRLEALKELPLFRHELPASVEAVGEFIRNEIPKPA